MVSPSKYCKTPKKDIKSGIDRLKKDRVKVQTASKPSNSLFTSSAANGFRPLLNKKCYLDIKRQGELNRLETTLKSCGATIEIFFTKDVDILVTDKTSTGGHGESPLASVSPLTVPSPAARNEQLGGCGIPKTRTSAMIEKVSVHPACPYTCPLELAQKWKIPVVSVANVWKWISKIRDSVVSKINAKKVKCKKDNHEIGNDAVCLNGGGDNPFFVKIESLSSPNKPELQILDDWPNLNLDGHLGQCPFRSPSPCNISKSDEEPNECKLLDKKNKVAVELIEYDARANNSVQQGRPRKYDEQDESRIGPCLKKKKNSNGISNRFSFKMTRRSIKYNIINHENDADNVHSKSSSLMLCNGYQNRSVTRQSSQELLKVQCNGLTTGHRSSKLLSPSGSDVLPLPTSTKRCTRRASASWCGSTRELSQLSPTDSEIENSLEPNSDCISDLAGSPGVALVSNKGQVWLPEEKRRRCGGTFEPLFESCSENLKNDLKHGGRRDLHLVRLFRCSDCPFDDRGSYEDEQGPIKKDPDDDDDVDDLYRGGKTKNHQDGIDSKKEREGSDEEKSCLTGEEQQDNHEKPHKYDKKSFRAAMNYSAPGRRKKLSPEEKLLQDNKEYFKMEVLNTKLRSSGCLASTTRDKQETESNEVHVNKKIDRIIIKKIVMRGSKKGNRWTNSQNEEGEANDGHLAAKLLDRKKRRSAVKINGIIRKKRQSELMTLCDEAESFMFGESRQEGHVTGPEMPSGAGASGRRRQGEKEGEACRFAGGSTSDRVGVRIGRRPAGKTRKKRRSHAEAFIHDNIDYYKFETPDSRLRYQNLPPSQTRSSCCNPIAAQVPVVPFSDSKSDLMVTSNRKRKRGRDETANEELEPSKTTCWHLGTGRILSGKETESPEAAVESHQRFETRKINSSRIPDEIDKILFSFERVPVTEPWYDVYKRQDEGMENYYPILSDPNDEPFLLPYELPKPTFTKLASDEASDYYKRKKRKFGHVLSNHPRKSPRCHASTLAILSSLKKRKRRSGTNVSLSQQQQPQPQPPPPPQGNPPTDPAVSPSNPVCCTDLTFESSFLFPEGGGALDKDYEQEDERMMLEPLSDSESKKNLQDTCPCSSERQQEIYPICGRSRSKKHACKDKLLTGKHFTFRNIETDPFFKGMTIETGKRSHLNMNIVSLLEKLASCKNADAAADSVDHSDFISDFDNGSSIADESGTRRRRKKCRKINKTGWDNTKKSRRHKLTTNKIVQVKQVTCQGDQQDEQETTKIKAKANSKDFSSRENAATLPVEARFSKRVLDIRNLKHGQRDDRTKTRAHQQVQHQPDESQAVDRCGGAPSATMTRRKTMNQENEVHSRSESCDSRNSLEYSPCVVRVKKINQVPLNASVKLRCANGRYSIASKRLVTNRKKKRVMDYAWTTRKRRR